MLFLDCHNETRMPLLITWFMPGAEILRYYGFLIVPSLEGPLYLLLEVKNAYDWVQDFLSLSFQYRPPALF